MEFPQFVIYLVVLENGLLLRGVVGNLDHLVYEDILKLGVATHLNFKKCLLKLSPGVEISFFCSNKPKILLFCILWITNFSRWPRDILQTIFKTV